MTTARNMFRLRIFVNPQTSYTNSNSGAIQTQAYDIALAQQIRTNDPGAKILLDFHYSDTWADPGHQAKPSTWSSVTTLSQLESSVQSYTTSTLTAFKTAGVLPDMVQIGNETTNGMLWQTGSSGSSAVGGRILYAGNTFLGQTVTTAQANQSWQNFGGLLNAAIAGVRAVQNPGQHIPIALSIDSGDQNGEPQYFYGNIQNPSLGNVTDFDVEGVDYYPSTAANKSFSFLQSNLTTLANTNYAANSADPKKIMLLETNYPYTTHTGIGISQWPSTPAGQEQEFLAVRNMMLGLPHNDGLGMLYWYPEAVQVPGFNIYNGGATALFDATSSHNALQTVTNNDFLVVGPGDFNADGHLSIADVQAMMVALMDPVDFEAAHNFTNADLLKIGDLNGDHLFNNADLQSLLGMMATNATSGGAATLAVVPEPETYRLMLIGAAMVGILYSLRIPRMSVDGSP